MCGAPIARSVTQMPDRFPNSFCVCVADWQLGHAFSEPLITTHNTEMPMSSPALFATCFALPVEPSLAETNDAPSTARKEQHKDDHMTVKTCRKPPPPPFLFLFDLRGSLSFSVFLNSPMHCGVEALN